MLPSIGIIGGADGPTAVFDGNKIGRISHNEQKKQ